MFVSILACWYMEGEKEANFNLKLSRLNNGCKTGLKP